MGYLLFRKEKGEGCWRGVENVAMGRCNDVAIFEGFINYPHGNVSKGKEAGPDFRRDDGSL